MPTPPLSRRQMLAGSATLAMAAAAPSAARQFGPILKGKSILITGASSGFGYLGALHYARVGAKVIASMRNLPRREAAALTAAARDEKLDLHVVAIDVLSDEQVAKGVAEAERIAGGGLDVLVNNAGIGMSGPVELQDMDAMRLMFDTNLYGYHRMARAVLPAMRARKAGLIVNVSSQLGRVIAPNIGVYCPTKFAIEAWAEQMAYELVPHGVEVTIIQPGGYPTEIWSSGDRYTRALIERAPEAVKSAYPQLMAGALRGRGGSTDPMDVPIAIAEIIALPPGQRPLRRAVHPGAKPQEPINAVSAEVQQRMLGQSPYGPWVKAVHG